MGLIILRLLKESSPVTALCPPTSKRLSPLTENGSICCLLLNHMRQLHSRCPHGRWTSRSSDSGPIGTRKQKSSSCSSASSCLIRGVAVLRVLLPDLLLLPWCLRLPNR